MEIWKDVKGFEDHYRISNRGNLIRKAVTVEVIRKGRIHHANMPERIVNFNYCSWGYPIFSLHRNAKRKCIRAHRLVATHFVEGEAEGLEVCHNDGNKTNFKADNLRWDTALNNSKDKYTQDSVQGKLTLDQVRWVRANRDILNRQEMAEKLKVSSSAIYKILAGITWSNLC